ncbi:MAG: hypothetical protein ACRDMV_15345 [Streptosporangiales bacterium]
MRARQRSLEGCEHRGCAGGRPDGRRTWPNLLTAVRRLAAVALVLAGVRASSEGLLSDPSYFHPVDEALYRLDWSPVAKAANTALLLVVIVGTSSWVASTLVAMGQLGVKLYSTVLLARLRPAYDGGGCVRSGIRAVDGSPP